MADPESTPACAPLRAVDWRFLLPHPPDGRFRHLVLLGDMPGLADRILEVGLARQVSDIIPEGRSVDAVVVHHRAHPMLAQIARCLVPGGMLYYEVDRRWLGPSASTPSRIRRSLRKVGLSPTALYAVMPDFSEHRMYLPLDIPGALRWYTDTLYNSFTPWHHLLLAGLRGVTGLDGRRFAFFAPRLAFTAVAGRDQPRAASILEHEHLPAELQGRVLRPLLLTHGGDRVVMLPFGSSSTEPAAVLKVPRLPGFNGRTEHEQATLTDLRTRLDAALRRSIPRSLGVFRSGAISVGVESYAPGELLFRSTENWGRPRQERHDDLRRASRWLEEFHLQTLIGRPLWGSSEISQWVEKPFVAYERAFGLLDSEERLFEQTRKCASRLTGTPLPLVLQHRDFTVWNITRSGDALTVLDWEGSRPGPALCDLLHFVTHWYEAVRHAHDEPGRQRSFRKLFFDPPPGDASRQTVHEVLAEYMKRLHVDNGFFPLLMVYTWVELALRRSEQQLLQEEVQPDPRDGNRSLAFVAMLARHAQQLFAGFGPEPAGHQRIGAHLPAYHRSSD